MALLTAILVVNAGSSSLKLRVLDEADSVTGSADLPPPRGTADAMCWLLLWRASAKADRGRLEAWQGSCPA